MKSIEADRLAYNMVEQSQAVIVLETQMTDKVKEFYKNTPQAENFSDASDPFALFEAWLSDAIAHETNDPDAMSLATVDNDGFPNVRMVLLKQSSLQGFVFYTNTESVKGQELNSNPKAALCFHWKSLRRQVRVRGLIEPVSKEQADEYFSTRSRGSQIGAWASQQSRPLESRFALEKAVAVYGARYAVGKVPRPEYWSGYCLSPLEIEFWHDRPFRLHERLVFRRPGLDDDWVTTRLFP